MSLQVWDLSKEELGNYPDYDNHLRVVRCRHPKSGLDAVIAIHNINLGPALGGCRLESYASVHEAVTDALRLSRGMTHKAALAGLSLGGGKAVIIENAKTLTHKNAQFRALGHFVNTFNGEYYTGEDVGVGVEDMLVAAKESKYVVGIKPKTTADGSVRDGDPSPYTAAGVLAAIRAAVWHKYKKDTLQGIRVSVKGCGHVGSHLVKLLHKEGATLFVADRLFCRSVKMNRLYGAMILNQDSIHKHPVHVFAPCALGSEINDNTISELNCDIVCGAANNMLQNHSYGDALRERRILYGVDYVANAGGLMVVATELDPVFDGDALRARIYGIRDTMAKIFIRSDVENKSTNDIAQTMAEERYMNAK